MPAARPTARVRALCALAAVVAGLLLASPAVAESSADRAASTAAQIPLTVDTPELRTLRARADAAKAALEKATAELEAAQQRLVEARAQAVRTQALADAARARVVAMRTRVGKYAASVYQGEIDDSFQAAIGIMTGDPAVLHALGYVDHVRGRQNDALDDMRLAEAEAAELSQAAKDAARRADAQEKALNTRRAEVAALSKQASAQLAAQVEAVNQALEAARLEQQAAADGATARWAAYVARLKQARITPPPVKALANPARLPRGMRPVVRDGTVSVGVAEVRDAAGLPLTVLPAETMRAVSRSLGALGLSYETDGRGPKTFDCGGLVATVYPGLPADPAEQYVRMRPVAPELAMPGDVVFLGDDSFGLFHVGVFLGNDDVLSASKLTGEVGIMPMPEDGILAIARATLGRGARVEVPEPADGMPTLECGAVDLASFTGSTRGGWGGYPNGLIPESAMCGAGVGSHLLRCDAATMLRAMAAAFAKDMKTPLCITDSYRSFAAQVDVYARKPNLAALPGNSNHGWGLALDLCGGIQTFGTPAHLWMQANAPTFGWIHPAWAGQSGSRPEAWHWEFAPQAAAAQIAGKTAGSAKGKPAATKRP